MSTRRVTNLLVYNSAKIIAVQLCSKHQTRIEARNRDIVEERKKRELQLQT